MKPYIEAGEVVSVHGVRGEVNLYPWADSADALRPVQRYALSGAGAPVLSVQQSRAHKNMLVLKLEGYDTPETARALIGKTLYVKREDLPLEEGRFFVQDLIGLPVQHADTGEVYGILTDVSSGGAQDNYHIRLLRGGEVLFPAVEPFLAEIDLTGGRILVRPIEGMLDDDAH